MHAGQQAVRQQAALLATHAQAAGAAAGGAGGVEQAQGRCALPPDLEARRLAATRHCRALDTAAEARFKHILDLCTTIFKAGRGGWRRLHCVRLAQVLCLQGHTLDACQLPRPSARCSHAPPDRNRAGSWAMPAA